ncbi:MAG: hypothetical protein FJW27_03985 [Acidimicrobiia bacterium]|nr:hypothetical protein [Acidimicrobiia bacterium]
MTYIDADVLNLIERLCQRFQQLTGRTNVWLAVQLTNLSIIAYFVWAAGVYFGSADLAVRVFLTLFCTGVFLGLTRTLFKESVEVSESDAYRRVAKGLRNPRRLRDAQLRVSFLTLSVLLAFFALSLLAAPADVRPYIAPHWPRVLLTATLVVGLTTVLLYVLACDPLPPCVGKVAEWVRGLVKLRPVRVRV